MPAASALRPGGVLMLGPSGSLGRSTALFSVLDKKHRCNAPQRRPRPRAAGRAGERITGMDSIAHTVPHGTTRMVEVSIDRNARKALERHAPA